MEVTSDSGAPTDSGDISSEASSMEDQKVCAICKVPVVSHIGKTGPGRCLGGAFTIAFRTLLETVSKLERELSEERAEARDREVRLQGRIRSLCEELRKEQDAVESLSKQIERMDKRIEEHESFVRQPSVKRKRKKKDCDDKPQLEMDRNVALGKRSSTVRDSCGLSRSNDWSEAPVGLSDGETDAISSDTTWSCSKDSTVRDQRSYANDQQHRLTKHDTHMQAHQEAEKNLYQQTANRTKRPDYSGWDSDSEDSLWELVTKEKPKQKRAVLYIGRLSNEISEEKLLDFIRRRADAVGQDPPKIFNVKVFKKVAEEGEVDAVCGARVTVGERAANSLLRYSFWPGKVYARAWNFDRKDDLEAAGSSNKTAVALQIKTL